MEYKIYHLLRELNLSPSLMGFAFLAYGIFAVLSVEEPESPRFETVLYEQIAEYFHTSTCLVKKQLRRATNEILRNNPSLATAFSAKPQGQAPSAPELMLVLAHILTEDCCDPLK